MTDLAVLLQQLRDWLEIEVDEQGSLSIEKWEARLLARLDAYQGTRNSFVIYASDDRCFMVRVPSAAVMECIQPAFAPEAWKRLDVSVLYAPCDFARFRGDRAYALPSCDVCAGQR